MDLIATAREMEAMAQTGLHYASDEYDRDRYIRMREIAAELLGASSDLDSRQFLEWSGMEFGYATPKVDVRAFIPRGEEVLLVREDRDQGRWTLPGGWADVNDTPSEAAAREAWEESGYEVSVERLLAVYDREKQGHPPPCPYHIYKFYFLCTITGGAPRANRESSECGFFPVSDLPELSLARVLPRQILDLHRMWKDSGKIEADFD